MEKRKEIFQLLGVIFGAVGLAVVVAAFMLYSYGPTGRYLAQNVLLDPALLPKLSFQEGGDRFIFDHIEIAYYEPSSQNFVKTPLDLDQYRKIYALVGTDRSMREPSDEVKGEFNRQKLVRLLVVVKPKGDAMETPFQTVDFASIRRRGNTGTSRKTYPRSASKQRANLRIWTRCFACRRSTSHNFLRIGRAELARPSPCENCDPFTDSRAKGFERKSQNF